MPCIAALDMGYGHLRAAAALADACGGRVTEVDRPPVASESEALAWRRARLWYERVSRLADAWYAPGARRLLDALTDIAPPGDERDVAPNFAARSLDRFVRRGLGAGLAAHLAKTGEPLVATFYAPAIAAAAHGAETVHLVVTDADVNRVWAPLDPAGSRITCLVPTEGAAARLAGYGVAKERIRVTGFPLPPELTEETALRERLAARLLRLDPRGVFREARRTEIAGELGDLPGVADGPPTIVFSVGGAGAQTGTARRLLAALREPLRRGELRLVLAAGTREAVAARFHRDVRAADVGDAAQVLHERDFATYYRRFNAALAAADVLWTKPSEMTFYGATGLALVLAPPLGVHERRNRAWALSLHAAVDQADVGRAARHLAERLADGSLAAAAWEGFRRMPRGGTRRILEEVARG